MRPPALLLVLTVALAPACRSPQTATPAPTASTPAAPAGSGPDWARDAVFYEVFVRSFADADGDGSGDLKGLLQRLDHLNDGRPGEGQDLEVDGLWLMPVFEASGYHGYDVTDYRSIETDYGDAADFDRLLREAHRRGMWVIVDLVVNHSGEQHPWFRSARADPSSPHRAWYLWREDNPGWTQPWGTGPVWHPSRHGYYYGLFWSGMPDLDLGHPPVRKEIFDIAASWLRRGVDGFRLDAARHLFADGDGPLQSDRPATFAFWRDFARQMRTVRPDLLLIGEVWADAATTARYLHPDASGRPEGLQASFNFALAGAIVEALRGAQAEPVRTVLQDMQRLYPPGHLDATFVGNHDMPRLASRLDGDRRAIAQATALLMTLPGTPFLYYGDELGVRSGPQQGDLAWRTPLPWDRGPAAGFSPGQPWTAISPGLNDSHVVAQRGDAASLLQVTRRWIRLRHRLPALRRGVLKLVRSQARVLAFERQHGDQRLLVAHNLGPDAQSLSIRSTAEPAPQTPSASTAKRQGEDWQLSLAPHSSAIWLIP